MERMWSSMGPLSVREVLGLLDRKPPLAYTTVLTVMDKLHRKGFLRREMVGRAYVYQPTKERAEHTADLMDELLTESGDRSVTLLRFVDRMSPGEIERLREALDE